jgi:hypothetical protein
MYCRSQIMLLSSLRYDVSSILYRIGTVQVNLHVVHMQPRPAPPESFMQGVRRSTARERSVFCNRVRDTKLVCRRVIRLKRPSR